MQESDVCVEITPDIPFLEMTWKMLKSGQKYDSCGQPGWVYACEDHHKPIFGVQHCDRPDCPECSGFWVNRRSKEATPRITAGGRLWRQAGRPIGPLRHIMYSPPQAAAKILMKNLEDFKRLRMECTKIAKRSGLLGALVIFHSHRQNKKTKVWYISPHFHVLGYGFLIPSKQVEKATGWVYKNLGKRRTVKGTIAYLLTHCGLGYACGVRCIKAITWIGIMACNKIAVDDITRENEPLLCSECQKPLHKWASCGSDYPKDWIDEGELPQTRIIKVFKLTKAFHKQTNFG